LELGGLHPITGRQWVLNDDRANSLWPDACVVVPFGTQVADATAKVVNPVPGMSVQGGWTVTGTLETLELRDLVQNTLVPGVTAVWAAGPGGDTPALHVLGDNPFAWLTPHLDTAASSSTTTYPLQDQWFGAGPNELFGTSRRFGHAVISPVSGHFGRLLAAPLSWFTMRVLQAPGARLSFSYPSGFPIVVDRLWLGVLLRSREELHGKGWELDGIISLTGGFNLALLKIDVGAGADSVQIPYGGSILFVRSRRRGLTVSTPDRITLQPGHYELTLSGTTTGKAPSGFDDAADVPWSATQRFWVDHPPSLRPYVHSSTFGDDRLFGPEPGFDPTLPGVGFPLHRGYLPVVRFCVPYVKSMFPSLRLHVDYPDAADVFSDVPVQPNADGESSLPAAAVDWKTAHGGTVPPDDEVVLQSALTPGPASLHISHVPAAGSEFELDSWGVQVSRFPDAATQLAWPGTTLTRYYRHDGPHDHAPCATLAQPPWDVPHWHVLRRLLRAHDLHEFEVDVLELRFDRVHVTSSLAGMLLHPVHPEPDMPDEYDTPPDDWPLPAPLASLAGPLDAGAAQRFMLFAWRSGVRLLDDAAAPRLADIGDPVAATTVEALCDDQDRPLALWLRTPEPLDWRRVGVDMTLRHVTPDTGCPTTYANRHTMSLTVDLLPSTDGSSALLVARLGGVPTRLPRGEITLTLRYDPAAPGIVKLRPRTPPPSGHETITLTFVQPLGLRWPVKPTPHGGFHVPHPPVLVEKEPHFGPPDPGPLREMIEILGGEMRTL
jgi:hypothetical protein